MKKNRGATIGIGVAFGFIAFSITVFFVPPRHALILGGFTTLIYILVFSLIADRNAQKYDNTDDSIEGDILQKDTANYYSGKLIANGLLYLTADRLIFVSHEKKPAYREEILLSQIKRATFGKVFRHIHGLKLFMADSTVKGFVLKDIETFLENINKVLTPSSFEED